jgi:hypothetical protein
MKKNAIVKLMPTILFAILLLLEACGVIKLVLLIGFFVSMGVVAIERYVEKFDLKKKITGIFRK